MIPHLSTLSEYTFFLRKTVRRVVPPIFLRTYLGAYPLLGAIFFRRPSNRLRVFGVTGTDGKSSIVTYAGRILNRLGQRTGYTSSMFFHDGTEEHPNYMKMTMPGHFFMQKFLRRLVDHRCTTAIVEVTSEGMKQLRHRHIRFLGALITNITPEHIEAHGGFQQYRAVKRQLVEQVQDRGFVIINAASDEAMAISSAPGVRRLTYRVGEGDTTVRARIRRSSFTSNTFELDYAGEIFPVTLPVGGPFVVENVVAAVALVLATGASIRDVIAVLPEIVHVPGRFDLIRQNPPVIEDYGHTIAALEKLLSYMRSQWHGQIIHVFGAAGGGRDRWKRPELARLSERYTDYQIVTEENPFDEDPSSIADDIVNGFSLHHHTVIPRRRDAVAAALIRAGSTGLVVCTAKGSETVIAGPYGRRIPYNEIETLKELCATH